MILNPSKRLWLKRTNKKRRHPCRYRRKDAKERVAAKYVLSDLTVEDITSSPAVDYNKDSVTK